LALKGLRNILEELRATADGKSTSDITDKVNVAAPQDKDRKKMIAVIWGPGLQVPSMFEHK